MPMDKKLLDRALVQFNTKYPSWSITGELLAYIWQQREMIEKLKESTRVLYRRSHQ